MFQMNGDVFYMLIDRIWKDYVISIYQMVTLVEYQPVRNKSNFLLILYNLFGFKNSVQVSDFDLLKMILF